MDIQHRRSAGYAAEGVVYHKGKAENKLPEELQHKHMKTRTILSNKHRRSFCICFCNLVTSQRGMQTISRTSNQRGTGNMTQLFDPPHLKKRPSTAPPRLLARPLAEKAPVAIFVAWLNLSQREKARVFVTASTMAMTRRIRQQKSNTLKSFITAQHTNQTQPNKMQSENGNDPQHHPTNRLRIQRQPEEPLIRSIYLS